MSGPVDLLIRIDHEASFVEHGLRIFEWVMRGGRYVKGTLQLWDTEQKWLTVAGPSSFYNASVVEFTGKDHTFQAKLLRLAAGSEQDFISAKTRFEANHYSDRDFGLLVRKYDKFEGYAKFAGHEVNIRVPAIETGPEPEKLSLLKRFLRGVEETALQWQQAAGSAFFDFQMACYEQDPEYSNPPEGSGADQVKLADIIIEESGEFILSYHAYDVDGVVIYGNSYGPERSEII